nr:T9SS type A sorting domain-containing protein [Saprospiraceae bacterium]
MNYIVLLSLFLMAGFQSIHSQTLPQITTPLVDTLQYTITDSVYLSVHGNDGGEGTADDPLRTFSEAVNRLPFGIEGVNGGHAYGLIIFQEGYYPVEGSLQQTTNQWKQGNTYKNISVRGEGEVIIGGTQQQPAQNTLLLLRGSHIYVKNIRLEYGLNIGLQIAGPATYPRQCSNIYLQNVSVDSVGSHGILISFAEYILAENISVYHSGAYDPPIPPYPCRTWPSGFKPHMSQHVTLRNSSVGQNWGEGVNFHNCQYVLAEHNVIHDNFGTNLYNDNSSNYIARNNLIFNTPGADKFWRGCYGFESAPVAAAGISIANERSCPTSAGFITDRTRDCVLECYHPINGTFRVSNVDSMFVYNNVILNASAALTVWEGVTELGRSCFQNIWIAHNTCVGFESDSAIANSGLISFFFPSGITIFGNQMSSITQTHITDNIFSYEPENHPNISIVRRVLDNFFPAPFEVSFSNNLWSSEPPGYAMDDETVVNNSIPTSLDYQSVSADWVSLFEPLPTGSGYDFMKTDFFGNARVEWTAGAIEMQAVNTVDLVMEEKSNFRLFPNPAKNRVFIGSTAVRTEKVKIWVTNSAGKPVYHSTFNGSSDQIAMDISHWNAGIYFVILVSPSGIETLRLVK